MRWPVWLMITSNMKWWSKGMTLNELVGIALKEYYSKPFGEREKLETICVRLAREHGFSEQYLYGHAYMERMELNQ